MRLDGQQMKFLSDKNMLKIVTLEELEKLEKNNKKIGEGTFSKVYLNGNNVTKRYILNPRCYYNDKILKFSEEDVIRNLIDLSSINHPLIATPYLFYVFENGELEAYDTKFLSGDTLADILYDEKLSLDELISMWQSCYDMADFLTHENTLMCDLRSSNIIVENGVSKFFDIDFWSHIKDIRKEENYNLVNRAIIFEIKNYFLNKYMSLDYDDKLFNSRNLLNRFIDDLYAIDYFNPKNTLDEIEDQLRFI